MKPKEKLWFLRGILATLAVIKMWDNPVLFDEVVKTAGAEDLLSACEDDDEREFSGMADYVERHKERGE